MSLNSNILNPDAPIIFMKGEETAGVVGDILRKNLLDELGISYEVMDVSVAKRILTQKKILSSVCKRVKESKGSTLVKEPTITPSPEQLLGAVEKLEREGKLKLEDEKTDKELSELRERIKPLSSEENMAKFAYAVVGAKSPVVYKGIELEKGKGLMDASGSPNAVWRKELGATLLRSVSPLLQENSKAELPEWSRSTPISVISREQDDVNTQFTRVNSGEYQVVFIPSDGGVVRKIGLMSIEGNDTPIRLYGDTERDFKKWFNAKLDALGNGAQITHALKQTVITTDYAYIEWMDDVLAERGLTGNIPEIARDNSDKTKLSKKMLTDNIVGAYANNPPRQDTVLFAPNASYADYVNFVEGIRRAGGFKNPVNSEVIRAAATKDHYAREEFRAEQKGSFQFLDAKGNIILERTMEKDDIAMVTNLDRSRVANLVSQTLVHALASGKTNILFGFDEGDIYYGIAVEELKKQLTDSRYSALNIKIGKASDLTVEYFSSGVVDALLALGNIQGDFATDIELAGKGTSYSKALLADGRMAIETGSLGTAPDILHDASKNFGWKKDGVLIYNPVAFVEAYSYALDGVAQNMGDDALIAKTAKALESAIYKTTRKGYVLPISLGTMIQDEGVKETKISTHTFVKHVLLETMRELEGVHPSATKENIARIENEFKNLLKLDGLIFAILDRKDGLTQKWRDVNWQINEKLIQQGKIDMDCPDYSIAIGSLDINNLTAESLLQNRVSQI